MPGYAAERERLILSFRGIASTTENPEIWDSLGEQRGMVADLKGGARWGVGRYEPGNGEKQSLWDEKLVSRPFPISRLRRRPGQADRRRAA